MRRLPQCDGRSQRSRPETVRALVQPVRTPRVHATVRYSQKAQILNLQQSCPPTQGQAKKLPFHIPVAVGLVGSDGKDLPLILAGELPTYLGTIDVNGDGRADVVSFVNNPVTGKSTASVTLGGTIGNVIERWRRRTTIPLWTAIAGRC